MCPRFSESVASELPALIQPSMNRWTSHAQLDLRGNLIFTKVLIDVGMRLAVWLVMSAGLPLILN